MKAWKRWQDWVSLALGIILFITPWVLRFAAPGSVVAWIIGVLGVLLALWALAFLSTASIAEGISLVLGIALFISPWVLRFAAPGSVVAWIIGVLFVAVNGWTLFQTRRPHIGVPA